MQLQVFLVLSLCEMLLGGGAFLVVWYVPHLSYWVGDGMQLDTLHLDMTQGFGFWAVAFAGCYAIFRDVRDTRTRRAFARWNSLLFLLWLPLFLPSIYSGRFAAVVGIYGPIRVLQALMWTYYGFLASNSVVSHPDAPVRH